MRLVTRLVVPHVVVALLLAAALVYLMVALVQMMMIIDAIQRTHLADFEQEEQLHRAAWDVTLAFRRGYAACETSRDREPEVVQSIRAARDALTAALQTRPTGGDDKLRRAARRYEATANDVLAADTCARVARITSTNEEMRLDEEATNAWIVRIDAIRAEFSKREADARRMGARAAAIGVTLMVLSWIAAAALARLTARGLQRSLDELAGRARRIGDGDFSPFAPMRGAHEIRALSLDIDRMRSKLAEVDQLKHAFVASVSHDLRSPLGRLREALAMLGDESLGPLNEQQQRVVALARAACEREIRLVTALLDLSRARSGQPLRLDEGCSISDIAERAVEDVAPDADAAGVAIHLDAPKDLPRGTFDAILVERALVNLVSNAISVSKRGERIDIECKVDRRAIVVVVRDHGPGIPPELRERIFEPYFTTGVGARASGGVGLGLSIAREMIRAHGGDIFVAPSSDGTGAAFSIRLPLAPSPSEWIGDAS